MSTPQRNKEFVWEKSGDTTVLWCDPEHKGAIGEVEGVVYTHSLPTKPMKIYIDFDPRYDVAGVKSAIEAIITG